MGIPTVVVTRQGFPMVVANAFAGNGFPAEAPEVVFPVEMFVPGSDISSIDQSLDAIVAGLTQWKPKADTKATPALRKIKVVGKDYAEAFANVNKLFLMNMWSDGLPIVPPTDELVDWLLGGVDLPPDKVVSKILPRGGIATVETVAVNLGMAGGRPEYMPVLVAALEAMSNPHFRLGLTNATTNAVYPIIIVNGPVAEQIRLGSGYGCLGPDPLHPAGGCIGRAIRLLLQGAGGAVPGQGTMSIYGGPARYTNVVFAEDEAGLPSDWEPLNVEQMFPRGSNTVTAYAVSGAVNICGGEAGDRDTAVASLNRAAGFISSPNAHYWSRPYQPEGTAGILLMASGTAEGLSKMGWSKQRVKTYLWENSKIPASKLGPRAPVWWARKEAVTQDPLPVSTSPDAIKIVVAGGLQSGHMMWFQVGCCVDRLTSAEIRLPADWQHLLKKAADDLGPLPRGMR